MTRRWSIARQLFALQVLVVTLLVAACTTGAVLLARRDARDAAIGEVTAVAETIAQSPAVIDALGAADPSVLLQPYAESTRRATHTDFIVVMAPDRTRYTHPTPQLIGRPFAGSVGGALAGGVVVEQYRGSLGDSWRAVVPVRNAAGTIIGLVAVGITTAAINRDLLAQVPTVAAGTLAALLLAAAGSALLSRRLRRQTHGLGPAEMTRMYEYYDAVLHAVREGLVVAGRDGRIELINDEARRLLGVPADGPAGPPAEVADLIAERRPMVDEPILAGDRILVASRREARFEGRALGTVLTLRDHTELRQLTGELDSVRGLTEALRAQAHEAANRLHTVLTLVELGQPEEAVRLGTEELALAQQLTDQVVGAVREPALAALLLGKSAQAGERGVELSVDPSSCLDGAPLPSRDLLTVTGNLVDNALEAVSGVAGPRRVRVLIRQGPAEVLVRVSDTGPGLTPQQAAAAFRRGWSTKPGAGRGVGLSLVRQVAERYGGSYGIDPAPGGGAVLTVRLPVPS
ncbi:sensor histidine kinase [Actinoplanes teichomyceticus]|uniref:histidine kinase n=1 Tax=Actinoplanes teichomyceticus TaxID=1867 RepID=A0A561WAP7_ACTTI|nr:sensor histidine kinase [Actinoplanes teichomyceticus]TWG20931.1 sensor histidine kinase regulating citrate/malate metabolism [Actinoplanes teichomyceticus]GIF16518.1 histidine kinase [Actinoplanes teichomyceticus]